MRLNLGHDLPYLITGRDTKRAIAPPEEVRGRILPSSQTRTAYGWLIDVHCQTNTGKTQL